MTDPFAIRTILVEQYGPRVKPVPVIGARDRELRNWNKLVAAYMRGSK